jgi:uncharacterized protein YunC (DUF1805 family)
MVIELLKRDPSWKWGLGLAALSAVAWPLLAPSALNLRIGSLLMCALQFEPLLRARPFETALPIRACDLFLGRLISRLGTIWPPVAAGAVSLLLLRGPQALPEALALCAFAMVLTGGVLVVLGSRIEESAAPRRLVWATAGFTLCGALLAEGSETASIVALAVCGVGSLAGFLTARARLPLAFQAQPVEPVPTGEASRAMVGLPKGVMRQYGVMALILGLCTITANWFLGLCCMNPMSFQTRRQTRWLWSFPLSRRALLWLNLLPVLLPLLVSQALYNRCYSYISDRTPRLSGPEWGYFAGWTGSRTPNVAMPLEYWSIAPGGRVPEVRAPWGEISKPQSYSLPGVTIYNPYAVGPGNSSRFLEWQFGRAAQAVYGRQMSVRAYQYARSSPARLSQLRPISMQLRFQILEIAAMLALVFAVQWLNGCGAVARLRWRPLNYLVEWLPMLLPFLLIAVDLLSPLHGLGNNSQALIYAGLSWLSRALPDGLWSAVGAAILLAALPYWALERQARRWEIPA